MSSISGAQSVSTGASIAQMAARTPAPASAAVRGRDADGDNDGSKPGEIEGALNDRLA